VRVLASGDSWRVSDIVCWQGPGDAPFEERHERVAIAAVLAGTFVYRSGHGRSLLTPGSVLLGNQGDLFCCSHEHGVGDRCVAFHFEPAVIEQAAANLVGVRRVGFTRHRLPPLEALVPLLADARALAAGAEPAAAEETAYRLASAALQLVHDGAEGRVSLADEARAAAAVGLIERHYAEPLSLGFLAEEAGLSRHHFLRVFRRVNGTTPYHYLLGRRLAAAAELLRSSEATVLEVALACGFSDLSEFTRRFGARFDRSPAVFRRETRAARPQVGPGGPPSACARA